MDPLTARRIRIVGLDVDGVLTDGSVYIGSASGQPVELKRFDVQDKVAIKLLRAMGIRVVLVSGRVSPATTLHATELGVDEIIQDDTAHKLSPFEAILDKYGLRMDEAAFVGDDLPDLPVLKRVALPATVSNAVPEVRAVARYATKAVGGHGAVREFVEDLLGARGEWVQAVEQYLREREPASAEARRASE